MDYELAGRVIAGGAGWILLAIFFGLSFLRGAGRVPKDAEPEDAGWIVGNGDGKLFRAWDCGPAWTADPDKALHFTRRVDAEEFCAEDEDAWLVLRHALRLSPQEVEYRRNPGRAA